MTDLAGDFWLNTHGEWTEDAKVRLNIVLDMFRVKCQEYGNDMEPLREAIEEVLSRRKYENGKNVLDSRRSEIVNVYRLFQDIQNISLKATLEEIAKRMNEMDSR